MAYKPSVTVEIAFTSSFATPAAARVWTDVSDFVEADSTITIGYGRQDERSQADANTLTLRLDNSDGRFTPGRATSPYYPGVRLYRPIRVTATPDGGSLSVRFVGYVTAWPLEWDGVDTYAFANLTASSRIGRAGLSPAFASVVEESVKASVGGYANVAAYYPLGDPEGSTTAADSTGAGAASLTLAGPSTPTTSVVFGSATGPPTDGLTAAQLRGGQYLLDTQTRTLSPNGSALSFFVLVPAPPVGASRLFALVHCESGPSLYVGSDGRLRVGVDVLDAQATFGQVADGATHHVCIVSESATTVRLYVDGVQVWTGQVTSTPFAAPILWGGVHGRDKLDPQDSDLIVQPLVGTLSHIAVLTAAPPAALVADIARAGADGFAGETSAARFARWASWAGIGAAEVAATGTRPVVHIDTTGQGLVELARVLEVTEGAVLHDARDGRFALTQESDRYTAAPAAVLDMARQHVNDGFAPLLDPATLTNDVTAAQLGGMYPARVIDRASRDENGAAADSVETASTSPDAPRQLAAWRVARFATPAPRVPQLQVDLLAQTVLAGEPDPGPSVAALLGLDVGARVQVVNQPAQAAVQNGDYFVEGYTETIGGPDGYGWWLSLNVSPAGLFTRVWVLDDPVRSRLDQGYVTGL